MIEISLLALGLLTPVTAFWIKIKPEDFFKSLHNTSY